MEDRRAYGYVVYTLKQETANLCTLLQASRTRRPTRTRIEGGISRRTRRCSQISSTPFPHNFSIVLNSLQCHASR